MGTALLLGCIVAAVGAWSHWLNALLWAGACSAVGWVTGFLFGIPRSLTSEEQAKPTMHTAIAAAAPRDAAALAGDTSQTGAVHGGPSGQTAAVRTRSAVAVNTNLEQISDWLTKIIVGVTLVQLRTIVEQLNHSARLMQDHWEAIR